MSKRFIRLKELNCNMEKNYSPSEAYLEKNNKLQKNEIYPVSTDANGNQFSVYKSRLDKEIYLIGDSSIESIYVRPSMRPHSCLEKILLENGYSYSVYNQGVSGSQIQNIINVIINKLGNKQGSTLILSLPTNDSTVLRLKENYFSDHWRYASVVPASNEKSPIIKNISYEPYIRNLSIVIEICKLLQINLFITTIVYTGINLRFKALNEIARNICDKKNVAFIDFEDNLAKSNYFFYDDVHFLPEGCRYYAETVFNNIKDSLETDGSKRIETHRICSDLVVEQSVNWSDYFSVSSIDSIKVIVDGEFSMESDGRQALLSVDYGVKNVNTNLAKSNNDEIGYFKYLTAPAGKRIELVIDLEVPSDCIKMRVGVRAWNSTNVKIHNAFISIIKA
ncbi:MULTISPECIES: SGNH/GDSL hydrolase family protein [unclassified Psychrobacter]|uniref:SGNH/GDSL hydrolase family protein n=1 Tax=unclassified Psychrobacter TaxID=196806 RepID=UPI00041FA351|nr:MULTISPECIES: SGNH/GDSL hydrolase family protein [unclassified Psychrobacter]